MYRFKNLFSIDLNNKYTFWFNEIFDNIFKVIEEFVLQRVPSRVGIRDNERVGIMVYETAMEKKYATIIYLIVKSHLL